MVFVETRGNDGRRPREVTFSQAILNPAASFGGLYAPKSLPTLPLEELLGENYEGLTLKLMELFQIDIERELLREAVALYRRFDDPDNPAPLVQVEEDLSICELYHGPTRAFKDMALQPFGFILSTLARQRGENYLILAATSGDTGPATLEAFKEREGIGVVCLYPAGGTSDVQRLQMVTEEGRNLKVLGIRGDFDDAQSALKSLLSSESFRQTLDRLGIELSAANSVNFGRIIFQTVYHIFSYLELVRRGEIEMGEEIDLIVPSGNFGNALGGYYAKKMGLPVHKIVIASNANNILTELIREGRYDLRGRKLIKTPSPAMDILKSSNVERVLFDKFGPERTRELMEQLDREGFYQLREEEREAIQEDFDGDFVEDREILEIIGEYGSRYLMDPHTATTIKLYRSRRGKRKCVAYSTAEWTKFAPTVLQALTGREGVADREALEEVSRLTGAPIPRVIEELFEKPIVHGKVVDGEEIEGEILHFLGEK
ncbi:MAG: threonine synthase [Epsilonproteobacteria bacterium]|nr:threonine synthase [Campylobacterota bacterium]NPA57506.1 threonine synthase [Campylobacterota bacterium]